MVDSTRDTPPGPARSARARGGPMGRDLASTVAAHPLSLGRDDRANEPALVLGPRPPQHGTRGGVRLPHPSDCHHYPLIATTIAVATGQEALTASLALGAAAVPGG